MAPAVPELVVIIGPIASGKTTVADALGVRLREAGRSVAVLDLDEIVETIGGFADLPPEHFRQAQLVYGQLVGAWLRAGFDVIAHGPFFQYQERDAVVHDAPDGTTPRTVLLHSTYETAVARVDADADAGRTLSKNLELLKLTYERVESLLPEMPPFDWSFDTTTTRWEQIVDEVAAALLNC